MPTLRALLKGQRDGPGFAPLAVPLAHRDLGQNDTYYVVAAGRCDHVGKGQWHDVSNGNSNFIAIEAENDGKGKQVLSQR